MPDIADKCNQICHDTQAAVLINNVGYKNMIEVAASLAHVLLDAHAVNTVWHCNQPRHAQESIISFLCYLDEELIKQLLINHLDLNIETHNGLPPFTSMINNAENDFVTKLLEHAAQHQSLNQRLIWINKTDSIQRKEVEDNEAVRLCYGLFSPNITISEFKQTPLQLTIAKGYIEVNGRGFLLIVSNLQLAEKLLSLGASQAINYQEPTKGNTALHIAYARRDYQAIALLEKHGASQAIVNKEGATPADMLSLTFLQAEKLMKFHTATNEQSHTYRLDKDEFHDQQNLAKIEARISVKRSLEIKEPAAENFTDKLNALRFNQALGMILLSLCRKKIKWADYYTKIKKAYTQAGGASNLYLPRLGNHISEIQYTTLQNSIAENKDAYEIELLNGEITREIASQIKLYEEPKKNMWEKIRNAIIMRIQA